MAEDYNPKLLALLYTYKCNCECEHCAYSCGPKNDITLPRETIFRVIDEAKELGLKGIKLTGGELFLDFQLLKDIVKKAKQAGIPAVNILTNAFWAVSEERAREMLKELIDSGFDGVFAISTGIFHLKNMPAENVFNAVNAYYALTGKITGIDFDLAANDIGALDDFKDKCLQAGCLDKIWLAKYYVHKLGRAASLEDSYFIKTAPKMQGEPCPILNAPCIHPMGDVIPCCGLAGVNFGNVIGNVHKESLKKIFENTEKMPIIQFLRKNPNGKLIEYFPDNLKNEEYPGGCEFCKLFFSNKELVDCVSKKLVSI